MCIAGCIIIRPTNVDTTATVPIIHDRRTIQMDER